jgi:hypothetical protein
VSRHIRLSGSYRTTPTLTGRSGTQRARLLTRTLQGMACVRSGQAAAWPLVSGRRGRRGSDAQGWVLRVPLTVEGRPRTLSGPSPDPGLTTAVHFRRECMELVGDLRSQVRGAGCIFRLMRRSWCVPR